MDRKVAVVTGASSGIGAALCRELVSRKWLVAMADLVENSLLSTELGESAHFFPINVSSYGSQAQCFRDIFDTFGRLDVLYANAGIVDCSSLYNLNRKDVRVEDIPDEPDLSCTDVVFKGVVYGTYLATHFMQKNNPPGGAIVATSSIAAVHPHPTYPEYNGAKAAVLNFVRGMSDVLYAKHNVRINTVLPGIVSTDIVPKEMIDAVSSDCLTPITTVTDAAVSIASIPSLYGQAVECSVEKQIFLPSNPFYNGHVTKRAVTVWEPLFKAMHSEVSGLSDAIV